ncbi:MAG: hypothetical protein KDB27_24930 [Planctomycetales bacterium]|nr:hypothetical protein [Planctomycetales bacterium]
MDESPAHLSEAQQQDKVQSFFGTWLGERNSRLRRFKFFVTGVAIPLICLLCSEMLMSTPTQPWQSGELEHHMVLLLVWPANGPFLPLILYSAVCMAWWTIKPNSAERLIVRFGIYTGVILSIHFLVVLAVATSTLPMILIAAPIYAFGLATVAFTVSYLWRRGKRFSIKHLIGLTAIVGIVAALARRDPQIQRTLMGTIASVTFALVAGPMLNLVTYIRAAIEVRRSGTNGQRLLVFSGIAWLVAWAGAWRASIELMFIEYAKLPTTNPNCYVSSAAAHGHRRFVGAAIQNGTTANMQMCRLKLLEFGLRAASPLLHRSIRETYDMYGPLLAKTCRQNVWFADTTYLLLKPIEYIAVGIQLFSNISEADVRRLYFREENCRETRS